MNEKDISEQTEPAPADLARQLRQHLDSLRVAGIYWLPAPDIGEQSAAPRRLTPTVR
jgi:hypothetical protein